MYAHNLSTTENTPRLLDGKIAIRVTIDDEPAMLFEDYSSRAAPFNQFTDFHGLSSAMRDEHSQPLPER